MTAWTYAGPQEYVLPHQSDPEGGGTLVLTPGRAYDFPGEPPGPAWWWQPAKAPGRKGAGDGAKAGG